MTLQRLPDGSVHISRLNKWHLEALRRIPRLADPGDDEKALHRVYPAPFSAGEATPEQQEDWAEYVQPELETLFEGSMERVAQDLKTARVSEPDISAKTKTESKDQSAAGAEEGQDPEEDEEEEEPDEEKEPEDEWELTVPPDHVEDWFRAMNQARLVLSSAKEAHRTDQDYVTRMLLNGEIETIVYYEMLTALCDWWVRVMLRGQV